MGFILAVGVSLLGCWVGVFVAALLSRSASTKPEQDVPRLAQPCRTTRAAASLRPRTEVPLGVRLALFVGVCGPVPGEKRSRVKNVKGPLRGGGSRYC